MLKILMINVPYSGHINPTLPLARELVQRGHYVDYINAPEWRGKIEETGCRFIPYINYPEDLSEQEKKTRCFLAAYNTAISIDIQYDLLIYEMFFFPGKTLAERLNIPCVRQFSQFAWNKYTVENAKKISSLWTLSCKLIDIQIVNKSTAKQMDIEGKKFLESVISEVPELNIVYLTEAFQPCRETFDERYLFVGPSIITFLKSDIKISYEKMQKPIIYISLGSIISSKPFYKRCLRAFGGKDMTVILSTGKVKPELLGKLPDNFYAYSVVPQHEVLQHTDLFITHGGMNSVNEAMFYGVPMLVMPIVNDQPINASQIEKLKIGRRMRIFPSTATKIYKMAMEVLRDVKIKDNVSQIQENVHSYSGAKSAADAIEKFMCKN